jgi:C-terminal processing protease CtpA/Prc
MSRLGLLALLMGLVVSPTLAQGQHAPLSGQDRSRGHRMLRQVREQLEKYYYDTTYHGVDIEKTYAQADSAIDAVGSLPEITGAIAEFLANLKDSHTWFYPPGYDMTVVYGWDLQVVGEACYVVAVKRGSDAEKKGLEVGDRVIAVDGIRPTRENFWIVNYVYHDLSPRPGARLVVEHPNGEQHELTILSEITRGSPVVDRVDLEQRRFREEQWRRTSSHPNHHRKTFGDSVMVWRMHSFAFGDGPDYADELIDQYMAEARKHRYLILDLRGNSGGAVVTERRLLGHFFGSHIPLGTDVRRDTTVQLTLEPVGAAPYEGEVSVLIDSRSASASEITARILQLTGRATIVGDRSEGAVMTALGLSLQLGSIFEERRLEFGMSVTVSDILMPDGKSLENTGVIPNIAVLPTAADLAAERDPALAFALELAGVKIDAREAAKIFDERRGG